ncbi:MAG: Crp/Fnr family transcriptional regulator [Vulcanimicrobiaceae bacterium]
MPRDLPFVSNRILNAIPEADRDAFGVDLRRVTLQLGEAVYEPYTPLRLVFFPAGSVLSIVTVMRDGADVEIATVGSEGFVPVHAALGGDIVPGRAIAQISGTAYVMPIGSFQNYVEGHPEFREILDRYAQAILNSVAQSVACNRLHTIGERCARWLLLTHDRVEADTFPLTQEFLATMLGVHRPSVSLAAGHLQQAGVISYSRGSVTIRDRQGLEANACECYSAMAREFIRLFESVSKLRRSDQLL